MLEDKNVSLIIRYADILIRSNAIAWFIVILYFRLEFQCANMTQKRKDEGLIKSRIPAARFGAADEFQTGTVPGFRCKVLNGIYGLVDGR